MRNVAERARKGNDAPPVVRVHKSKGGFFESRGSFYMRVFVAKGDRRGVLLPWIVADATHHAAPCDCRACKAAGERGRIVQDLVNRLRAGGHEDFAEKLVERAAAADAEKLAVLARIVDGLVAGRLSANRSGALTFRDFAERWTNGTLAREFPDHVKKKKSVSDDIERLEKHVYPRIGDQELQLLTLDDALDVMRKLPEKLSPASRRHVAQLLSRTFALAVYPCQMGPRPLTGRLRHA